ncbi:MAG: hypothetical protein AAFU03_07350 [Bacteroidota bacterium]
MEILDDPNSSETPIVSHFSIISFWCAMVLLLMMVVSILLLRQNDAYTTLLLSLLSMAPLFYMVGSVAAVVAFARKEPISPQKIVGAVVPIVILVLAILIS